MVGLGMGLAMGSTATATLSQKPAAQKNKTGETLLG